MIDILVNGRALDLTDQNQREFWVTKQVYDLVDLQTRNADNSKIITIPASPANKDILNDYLPSVTRFTTTPIDYVSCQVYMNSVPIMRDPYLLVRRANEEQIQIAVFGANAIFFSLLRDAPLSDIDFSDLDFPWSLTAFSSRAQNTTGVCTAQFQHYTNLSRTLYERDGNSDDTETHLDKLELGEAGFYLFAHTIIERIFATLPDVTLDTGNLDDLYFEVALFLTNPAKHNFYSIAGAIFGHVNFAGPGQGVVGTETRITFGQQLALIGIEFDTFNNEYDVREDGDYDLECILEGNTTDCDAITLRIYKNTTMVFSDTLLLDPGGPNDFTIEVEGTTSCEVGDTLHATYEVAGSATGSPAIELVSSDFYASSPSVGDIQTTNIDNLLPDITQRDFVIDIMKMFNIVALEEGNTITFRHFKEIRTKEPGALEIDESRENIEVNWFGSYYQTNVCKYADNELINNTDQNGNFPISSRQLPLEGVVIDLKHSSSDIALLNGGRAERVVHPNYNLEYEYITSNKIDFRRKNQYRTNSPNDIKRGDFIAHGDQRRRVIQVSSETEGIVDTDWTTKKTNVDWHHWRYNYTEFFPQLVNINSIFTSVTCWDGGQSLSYPSFAATFPSVLRWPTLLDNYYDLITAGFLKPFAIQRWVKLTDLEVAGFDHLKAYYIEKYKSYFYVNKIEQYRDGFARVQLLELIDR